MLARRAPARRRISRYVPYPPNDASRTVHPTAHQNVGSAGGCSWPVVAASRSTAVAAAAVCIVNPSIGAALGCHRRSSNVPAASAAVPAAGSRNAHDGAVPGPRSPATTSPTPARPNASPQRGRTDVRSGPAAATRSGCVARSAPRCPPARPTRSRSPRPRGRRPGSADRARLAARAHLERGEGDGSLRPARARPLRTGSARPAASSRSQSRCRSRAPTNPELHSTTSAAASAASALRPSMVGR